MSHSLTKTALVLPPPVGRFDNLHRLMTQLSSMAVEIVVPDSMVSKICAGGVQAIGATKWTEKTAQMDPLIGVFNGILAGEHFEDPLIHSGRFGSRGISYVIAPLPDGVEDCLSYGGFELGKIQVILTAITAADVIPVVSSADYELFLLCLAERNPARHEQAIRRLKAAAAEKLGAILEVLRKLNANAAAVPA